MNHLLLVTDAWEPQVNGVVTTFRNTIREMQKMGWKVTIVSPKDFSSFAFPFYKEIHIPITLWKFASLFEHTNPTHVHVATEGLLGLVARRYCVKNNIKFTTSYHTNFAEYGRLWIGLSSKMIRSYLNWFHKPAKETLVPSTHAKQDLDRKTVVWGRGVEYERFQSDDTTTRYKILCVSRASKEKNLDAFVSMEVSPSYIKVLVGDGPYLDNLGILDKKHYGNTLFMGKLVGDKLVREYQKAAVFVFPSVTDTFGIVMLEALAAGVPVLAYNTGGAPDIIQHGVNGYLLEPDERFEDYIPIALQLDHQVVANTAKQFTWQKVTEVFVNSLLA
jgi:glycosyltransferase involved in cell wall biosynthesis